jgi:ABC-2 type transport system ATP-binding protein
MIELRQLRKEYDDVVAARDISLTIPAGEIYGLVGPNGAGKTTLIRMACGLLLPTSGTVRVAGVDVHAHPEEAQQHIGYVSDFFNIYDDLKVWEYLDYFAHAYRMPEATIRPRIGEVIEQVGLTVKRDQLIKGLSRGMKQRLGIARAVIHKPKLLLLDEPASGLDPKARFELKDLLRSLRDEGATVLVSSHILPDLEDFCTSLGVMEKGTLLRSGSLDEIAQAASPQRTIAVRFVGGVTPEIETAIAALTGVSGFALKDGDATFRFAGSEIELAQLLRELVQRGLPVLGFSEVRQTVEEIYLKISHHEVM